MVEKASRLKITVLRRFEPEEVLDTEYKGGATSACSVYEDGQVLHVEEGGGMPKVFCGGAWGDLYKVVQTLQFNGNFKWFGDPGVSVNC